MSDKQKKYALLVEQRKACSECARLTNASACGGTFDSSEIGAWTRWQADLDARVIVVGQDWGDWNGFRKQAGVDSASNATNRFLRELLASVGIEIAGPTEGEPERRGVFLTNAILCYKEGGAQAEVQNAWFDNCGKKFLRPQIDLINPRVVVCLGERAYRAVMKAYGLRPKAFRAAVDSTDCERLSNGTLIVPVYHCGRRIVNTHRNKAQQIADWRRVAKALQP